MTWREVLEQLQKATPEQLDSNAFVSCDPADNDPENWFRYHGTLEGIQATENELQAYFVGYPNEDEYT